MLWDDDVVAGKDWKHRENKAKFYPTILKTKLSALCFACIYGRSMRDKNSRLPYGVLIWWEILYTKLARLIAVHILSFFFFLRKNYLDTLNMPSFLLKFEKEILQKKFKNREPTNYIYIKKKKPDATGITHILSKNIHFGSTKISFFQEISPFISL